MHGPQADAVVRKACFALLPFQAGLLAAFLFKGSLWLIPAAIGAAAVVCVLFKRLRAYAVVCAVSVSAGLITSSIYTGAVYERSIAFDGQSVSVKGYVYDKDEFDGGSKRVTVKGEIGGRVTGVVSFYISDGEYERLTYGDEIDITGKVYKITDSISYQSESYYKANGVFLKGKRAQSVIANGENHDKIFRFARELRDKSYTLLCENGGEGGEFLGAMLCGDKSSIDSDISTLMYRAGIGHIFAFSGTHIAIIISFASVALETVSKRRRVNVCVLMLLTWWLVLFSGLAVSAIRAAVMMSVLLLSQLAKRRSDPLTSLSIAGFLITSVSPYSVASYSFLLSVMGALACSAYTDFLCERINADKDYPVMGIKRSIIAVFAVGLLQLPINSLLFGEVSIIAPVTNLLMIPLCGVCLTLSVLGLCVNMISSFLSGYILWFAAKIMSGCVTISAALARLPFASVNTYQPTLKALMMIIGVMPIVILMLAHRRHLLIKAYAVSAAVMIAVSAVTKYALKDKITLIAYSTEHGESLFIYDSFGSAFITNDNVKGFDVLERLFIKRGAERLDAVICKDSVPDIPLLTDDKTEFDSAALESSELGSAGLDDDRIVFLLDGLDIVISGKIVYNNSSGYETALDEGAVEIIFDKKDKTIKTRRLDNGFDITF